MNIVFTPWQEKRIEELKKSLDVKTKSEVIRRALQILSAIDRNPEKAAEALLKVANG